MEMQSEEKFCHQCGETKPLTDFNKNKSKPDGLSTECKCCIKINNQKYWEKNKNELKVKNKGYRDTNKETINKQRKIYRSKPEIKEHVKIKNKEYLPTKKEKIKNKRKTDMSFRISETLRSKIHKMLSGKNTSYQKLLGCDTSQLKNWLEFQFDGKMTWNNYGEYWQIDHIIPISIFKFDNDVDKIVCFHWRNLQPLEKTINREKTNKIEFEYIDRNILMVNNFIKKYNLNHDGYQKISEMISWLKEKFGYGKNPTDIMENPHPKIQMD